MTTYDKVFTAEGSPNIAFIKYWGKRDEKLILPYNSSLSMTFSHETFNTLTSVMFSKKLSKDIFYIGGQRQDLKDSDVSERFGVIDLLRKMAGSEEKAMVVSKNNFPTASGLASSASGIATLVYAASSALELNLTSREMSIIARQGSGSACRSIFGGISIWNRGEKPDGSDSFAEQAFDENHWPELVDEVIVVSQEKKKVPSRAGMRQTVETNPLFTSRPEAAAKRLAIITEAFRNRDMHVLSECMMADSNEMHALMLSTRPSIRYLNNVSFSIMAAIEELNAQEGRNIAGYTFDAGPNANVVTTSENKSKVLDALRPLQEDNSILYIKESKAGEGPKILGDSYSLIDEETLKPR